MSSITTLGQFIIEKQKDFPYAKGEFSRLLRDIGIASKIVNREVTKAGLVNILGVSNAIGSSESEQRKLDVYANKQFIAALSSGRECCAIVSEENDEPFFMELEESPEAKYIVTIDPLDGSSNLDVNVSVGTIFSIYRRKDMQRKPELKDILQKGTEQIAAGYVVYGSSAMLVYTTGNGVNGFTLDPSIGEFCLSHPNMKIPPNGTVYSVNQGNYVHFPEGVKRYIKYCQVEDEKTHRPYNYRYIGSMIADMHRNLFKGGIFIYPATSSSPAGKLRLMYECNPMAFILEQAGGRASDGYQRILDIPVKSLHQRSPVFMGSKNMVLKAEEMMRETSPL